jgi:GTP-binding protein Era
LERIAAPIAILINKIDQSDEETVKKKGRILAGKTKAGKAVFAISALHGHNIKP